jgi:hypothetical protein
MRNQLWGSGGKRTAVSNSAGFAASSAVPAVPAVAAVTPAAGAVVATTVAAAIQTIAIEKGRVSSICRTALGLACEAGIVATQE